MPTFTASTSTAIDAALDDTGITVSANDEVTWTVNGNSEKGATVTASGVSSIAFDAVVSGAGAIGVRANASVGTGYGVIGSGSVASAVGICATQAHASAIAFQIQNSDDEVASFSFAGTANRAIAFGDFAGTVVIDTAAQAFTNKIYSGEIKVLAANATYDNSSALATLTGMSWTVVAGATYKFKFHATVVMTTSGGLKMAFKLTTATLTSIAIRARQSTDADNTGAISAAFTTTTDIATWFAQKTVAYTNVIVEGTFVVGTGGTIAVQAAQETAASGADSTIVNLGAYAELTRAL